MKYDKVQTTHARTRDAPANTRARVRARTLRMYSRLHTNTNTHVRTHACDRTDHALRRQFDDALLSCLQMDEHYTSHVGLV